jgi:hypothetical protein
LKVHAELWVKLKVTDLVVETSWLTLTEKLDYEEILCGIVRYFSWFMSAENGEPERLADELDRVLSMDSAFINQNKHRYSLIVTERGPGKPSDSGELLFRRGDLVHEKDFPLRSDPAAAGSVSGGPEARLFACDCFIRETDSSKDAGFRDRLNGRLNGSTVSDMRAGEVWRIMVLADDEKEAGEKVERMAVTRSRREGLLLNPHYQEFEIIGVTPVEV